MPSLRNVLIGAGVLLLVGGGVFAFLEHYHERQGTQAQQVSHQQDQEAQSHAHAAESIPDHSATVQATQADADATKAGVARAREQVARAERDLATHPGLPVSVRVAPGSPQPEAMAHDPRDDVIASQAVLIKVQDVRIKALEAANTEALNAYHDELKRSAQWEAAYNNEHAALRAQEVATQAWKEAVKESLWKGRIEGFVVGSAIGYAGGKL